jgi:hypothetical protein
MLCEKYHNVVIFAINLLQGQCKITECQLTAQKVACALIYIFHNK